MNRDKWNKAFAGDQRRGMAPLVLVEGPDGRYELATPKRGFHGQRGQGVYGGAGRQADGTGPLSWDSRIADWFKKEELDGLFTWQGKDYQGGHPEPIAFPQIRHCGRHRG